MSISASAHPHRTISLPQDDQEGVKACTCHPNNVASPRVYAAVPTIPATSLPEEEPSLASLYYRELLQNTSSVDQKSVSQFISKLDVAELAVKKKFESAVSSASPAHPMAQDVYTIAMHVCRAYLFPTLIEATPSQQTAMLEVLDHWLKELLPKLLTTSPNPSENKPQESSSAANDRQSALLLRGLSAFSSFIKDYSQALKAKEQTRLGKWLCPTAASEMDRLIAEHLQTSALPDHKQILKEFVQELQLAGSPEFTENIVNLIEEMIHAITHSSLLTQMMEECVADENPLRDISAYTTTRDDANQEIAELPVEMKQEFLRLTESLIELGNPGLLPWLGKQLFVKLPQHLPPASIQVLTQFIAMCCGQASPPAAAGPKTDIAAFAIHLIGKYLCQDSSKSSKCKDLKSKNPTVEQQAALSRKLYQKVHTLALAGLPSSMAKATRVAEYIPLINAVPQLISSLATNVLTLLQRPESLKVFIYQYLLKDQIIPYLKQSQSAAAVHGAVPLQANTPFERIGIEGAALIARYLKDYLLPMGIKTAELNPALIPVLVSGLETFLPKIITAGMVPSPPVEGQHQLCDVLGSLTQFINDYAAARNETATLLPGPAEAYTLKERNQALIKALNTVRRARGATSLQHGPIEKQKKLTQLSQLVAHAMAKSGTALSRDAIDQIVKILPPILENLIALASPQLFNQFLISVLTAKKDFETVPLTLFSKSWSAETLTRLFSTMTQLADGCVRLGNLEDQQTVAVVLPVVKELLKNYGDRLATFSPGENFILDSAASLNTIRLLQASLWERTATGELKPSMGATRHLTAQQKQELKEKLALLIKQKMTLPPFVQQALTLVGVQASLEQATSKIVDGLFDFIQDPFLIETLIYNYLFEDLMPMIMQSFSSSEEILSILSINTKTMLHTAGLYWEVPNQESRSSDPVRIALDLATASPNYGYFLASLQEWGEHSQGIDRLKSDPLHLSTWNRLLWQAKITETEKTALTQLCQQGQFPVVTLYLNYRMEQKPLLQAPFKELRAVQQQLDDFTTGRKSDLLETLVLKNIQSSFSNWLSDSQRSVFATVVQALSEDAEDLSEELATQKAIQMTILRLTAKELTPETEFLQEIAKGMKAASQPILYLSQVFNGLKQVHFWQQTLISWHATIDRAIETDSLPDELQAEITAFYQDFGKKAHLLFGFPLNRKQKDYLFTLLQQPLLASANRSCAGLTTDLTAPIDIEVCADSKVGVARKLELIAKAEHSIVMSGCYFGKKVFSQALRLIQAKIEQNPTFKTYLMGSEYMLSEENKQLLTELTAKYPKNFHAVITPEIVSFHNPKNDFFSVTSNHVKLLVIDEGKEFIIGGSGLEDRWANHTGTEEIVSAGPSAPKEPLSFRDADFVFSSPTSSGIGKVMQRELLKLFAHCLHLKEAEMAERYFDPTFYPLDQSPKIELAVDSESVIKQSQRVEFFATGPEEVSNRFHERLIELVNEATTRIVIDHMYFHPSEKLLNALIRASNRGVKIIIVTNQDGEKTPLTHKLFVSRSRLQWKKLFEGHSKENISIFEYMVPYTTLHKKVFVIDDALLTGSSNCGYKSLESLDYEYNVIAHSKEAAEQTLKTIEADFAYSRAVPAEEAYKISLLQQAAGIATAPLELVL